MDLELVEVEALKDLVRSDGWHIYTKMIEEIRQELDHSIRGCRTWEAYVEISSCLDMLERRIIPLVREQINPEQERVEEEEE